MRDEDDSTMPHPKSSSTTRRSRRRGFWWLSSLLLAGACVTSVSSVAVASPSTVAASSHAVARDDSTPYPVGTPDSSEPSGEAPPSSNALPGYQLSNVTEFTGSSLPSGWGPFSGEPGSDPGAWWSPSHVVVSGGELQLDASQNSAGNWVTGGVCQCGLARTYGAYFVRSRMTGPGPTQVELLWPTQGWPPEIDFNETFGSDNSSMATLHYTSGNQQIQTNNVNVDMTRWHTWGVIWTPSSVIYTLDGVEWGSVTQASAIPDQPMTLDIQQQTWCSSSPPWACPTANESTDVAWVAEYSPSTSSETTDTTNTAPTGAVVKVSLRPFAQNSATLSASLKHQIAELARRIRTDKASIVDLVGFTDDGAGRIQAISISRARALVVKRYLANVLRSLDVKNVTIRAVGDGTSDPVASNTTAAGRALNRRVLASIR